MRSVEWTLLGWVVPVATWLHLEVGPIPQLTTALLLLIVVGALVAAICIANALTRAVRVLVWATAWAPTHTQRDPQTPVAGDRPRGGNGPRAPAFDDIRSLAAV
ncbi:MAG: hypothetical protein ABWX66_02310 [Lacisediminihabitans sp.]